MLQPIIKGLHVAVPGCWKLNGDSGLLLCIIFDLVLFKEFVYLRVIPEQGSPGLLFSAPAIAIKGAHMLQCVKNMEMSKRRKRYNKPIWFGWTSGMGSMQHGKAEYLVDRDIIVPDEGNILDIEII